MDLFSSIGPETFMVNLLDVSTINNGARAAWLLNNYWPQISNQSEGAALQLAIWDVVHDGGDGFGAGRVQHSQSGTNYQSVFSQALSFELASVGHASNNAAIYTDVNGATAHQRLMGATFSPTPMSANAVPEPATYMLMGSGLLAGFIFLYSRTKR